MANLPNRPHYGNLSCVHAVFMSRHTSGGIFTVKSLKYDGANLSNALDICLGAVPLSPRIGSRYTPPRTKRCPFFKNSSGSLRSICQAVHSLDYDGQASKPAGSAVTMLELLGLCEEVNPAQYPKRTDQRWTNDARTVSGYAWGSGLLRNYIHGKLKTYGPLLCLAKKLQTNGRTTINRTIIRDTLWIKCSSATPSVTCSLGTITTIQMKDGNTSSDASTRTTTAILNLAMALGLVSVPAFAASGQPVDIFGVSTWLNNNPKINSATKWDVNLANVNNFLLNAKLEMAIHCKHFTTKAVMRNSGQACTCGCPTSNIYNQVKSEKDQISRHRKLLLCEAIGKASRTSKKVDLQVLSNESLTNAKFVLDPRTHYTELKGIELHNVSIYGAIHDIDGNDLITPVVEIPADAFGTIDSAYVDANISAEINAIVSTRGVLV